MSEIETKEIEIFTAKDLVSDQDIRWCPGCGDYSILKQMQTIVPKLGVAKEDIVFVSGIGCSSRFPYYMNTYGLHSIHGRATAVASGLKIARPELQVWVITGDGDSLSIGGNHTMHLIRRNIDLNVLVFNNEIYGLTKGQYSPTSHEGQITKSTPFGSLDHPLNPLAFALGAGSTFIARSMDRDPKNLQFVLTEAAEHKGTSFVEIYQNCSVFNDGAFEIFTEKITKAETCIFLEEAEPLVFGNHQQKGIILDGLQPRIVDLSDGQYTKDDLWKHDSSDKTKAYLLTQFYDDMTGDNALPRPFGVLYISIKDTYEKQVMQQIEEAKAKQPTRGLDAILGSGQVWKR